MRKKALLVTVFLISILVALPFISSCAPKAPDVNEVDLLASKMGGLAYIATFGLADIINKNHPWLRANAFETTGTTENLKSLALEPERRSKTIIFSLVASSHQARIGDPPYEKPYTTSRAIALFNASLLFLATLDPNLKTPNDLIGKKVGVFPKGSASNEQWLPIFEQGYGIDLEDIDWVYTPMGPGFDAFADGRVDATWLVVGPPPKYAPAGPLSKALATKDVYFIGFSPEAMKLAEEASGYPVPGDWVPAGSINAEQPKLYAHLQYLSWWADLELDDDIVYEVTKTIYENVEKFGDYHAATKAMTKDNLAAIAVSEELFHPGAVRFYKEKGVKIGTK